jgi:hypothetical protein
MENVKQLYQERLARLNTALAGGKPDRCRYSAKLRNMSTGSKTSSQSRLTEILKL